MNTTNLNKFEATAKSLVALNITEIPMLWGDFIPKKAISILVGSSDCGKSTLLKDLALSVAYKNDNFLGYKINHDTGNVLYLSTEEQEEQISYVLCKQIKKYGLNDDALERLNFLYYEDENPLSRIEEKLNQNKHDLIIIDSLGDLMEGNSNSVVDMRKTLKPFSILCKKYDATILLLHHNVKNSEHAVPDKNRMNGSQGIEAKSRSVIDFRKDENPDFRYITMVKGNLVSDSLKRKGIKLEFDPDTFTYSSTGNIHSWESSNASKKNKFDNQELYSRLIGLKKEGFSYAKIKEILDKEFEKTPGLTWLKENYKKLENSNSSDRTSDFKSVDKSALEYDLKSCNNE